MRIPNFIKRYFFLLIVAIAIIGFGGDFWYGVNDAYKANIDQEGLEGEIVGGVITTIIISFFCIMFMPIMEVSKNIIKYPDGSFKIKIYNSSLFAAYDTKVKLVKVKPTKRKKQSNNVFVDGVKISTPELEYLPSMHNKKSKENGNTFAIVHTVYDENIESILQDEFDSTYYRLTIYTVGGISGLRKIYREHYTYNSIKEGKFKSGATFALEK